MPSSRLCLCAVTAALMSAATLTACGGSEAGAGAGAVAITASDTACTLDSTTFDAGQVSFDITNTGTKVTEVYVFDGERIVAEKEDIGPGTSRQLSVSLKPGSYEVACKPGQSGDGIRAKITVTG